MKSNLLDRTFFRFDLTKRLIFILILSLVIPQYFNLEEAKAVNCAPTQTRVGNTIIQSFTATTTCDWTVPAGVSSIRYLVVGGGGSGGSGRGGGGGAGGLLRGNAAVTANQTLEIKVGAGGAGSSTPGANTNGDTSTISGTGISLIAPGGGKGGSHINSSQNDNVTESGADGGSGGGASMNYMQTSLRGGSAVGGTVLGNAGAGSSTNACASRTTNTDQNRNTGGGGGAGSAGVIGCNTTSMVAGGVAPDGGNGLADTITGTSITYATGGGGAGGKGYDGTTCESSYYTSGAGAGGSNNANGGRGQDCSQTLTTTTANRGAGGGGVTYGAGGDGSSGIVIISYVFSFTWFNPPAGGSTTPGSFTPSWTNVSDGTPRLLISDYTFSSNSCSGSWTDTGTATNNFTVSLLANKCYKWTFDSDVSSSAVAPTLPSTDKKLLTSGVLKIYSASCKMESTWDVDTVTITYNLSDSTSGIDCRSEFGTPINVGKIDFLLVGGGGAGGWASTTLSQGGGGGGGGGMSFSQRNATTTPGRTYLIEVGAGAVIGTRTQGQITCKRGVIGDTQTSTKSFGGTSKLSAFVAEGGGCAKDTGGSERGSDGGISANGRTGGRGGSGSSRGVSNSRITLDTTSFYTTAPTMSDTLTAQTLGFGDGSTASNAVGLQAWEGGGGGGGASFTSGTTEFACSYASNRYRFVDGCDGIDIPGQGAMGGRGGDGIQSWYQGACNFYFGGGGGAGGSTGTATNTNSNNFSYFGLTAGGKLWTYSWDGSKTVPTARTGTNVGAVKWAPLGGPGGLGGGGQAATSKRNIDSSTANSYQNAISGVHGCGGGGGGGQAYKGGVDGYSSSDDSLGANLDKPGQGGNGIAVIRFLVAGANYSSSYNPNIKVPSIIKINPVNKSTYLPIKLLNSDGSGYICLNVASPTDTSTVYSSSTNLRFVRETTTVSAFLDTGTVNTLQSRINDLVLKNVSSRYLINNSDSWSSQYKLYLLVRYSGSDSISNNSCSNSSTDLAYGNSSLIQSIQIQRLPVSSKRRQNVPLKNGKQ